MRVPRCVPIAVSRWAGLFGRGAGARRAPRRRRRENASQCAHRGVGPAAAVRYNFGMTYCVGLLVDTGLVMLSDSRTNAGVDQINTFRKMATFLHAHDRVLVLMSAGNLGITQAVINLLETPIDGEQSTRLLSAPNMFNAARVVGDALREIHER